MLVFLKDEAGQEIEESFSDMNEAAKFCVENADYGITLYPENDESEWDYKEWQNLLDYYSEQ